MSYLILIAVLSLLPVWLFPQAISQMWGMDKLVHVGMYGVLGVLLRWAAAGNNGWTRGWRLPLAGAGYGWVMECFQYGFSGGARTFSMGDAIANLVGVSVFWWWTNRHMNFGAANKPVHVLQD